MTIVVPVRPPTSMTVTWDSLAGKPVSFPPSQHTHTWADITGKPTTFPPAAHGHAIANIAGLQAALLAVSAPISTALAAAEKNGAPFQPAPTRPCQVNVTASLTGLIGVTGSFEVAIAAAAGGPYTPPVSLFTLTVNAAGVGVADTATGPLLVPAGWWVKVTLRSSVLSGLATVTSLLAATTMNRVVWSL